PASVFNSRLHGAKEQDMDLGFIGLGEMGQAIATNLLKAGHTVRVWNRSRERAEPLAAFGAQIVDTPAAAFRGERRRPRDGRAGAHRARHACGCA
ncbi:NAD(P)-binding domain-containing protein, partial [Bacillus subtilis]|nr:NAD(P)-binding domain-containing protein [Bacillus subtilis]